MSIRRAEFENRPLVDHKKRRLAQNGPLAKLPYDIFSFIYTFLPFQDMRNINLTDRNWHMFSHDIPGYINSTFKADIETMFTFPGSNDASKKRFFDALPPKLDMKHYEEIKSSLVAIAIDCFIKGESINRTSLILLQTPLHRAATIAQAILLAQTSSNWTPIIKNCTALIDNKNFKKALLITQFVTDIAAHKLLIYKIFHAAFTHYTKSRQTDSDRAFFITLFNQMTHADDAKDRIIINVMRRKDLTLAEALIMQLPEERQENHFFTLYRAYLAHKNYAAARRISQNMAEPLKRISLQLIENFETVA